MRCIRRDGLRVLSRNYRTVGGEIDIIAVEGDWLVFVEVKAERSVAGQPESKVTARKRSRLLTAAKGYISRCGLDRCPARFDVVTVTLDGWNDVVVDHQRNAFEAQWQRS